MKQRKLIFATNNKNKLNEVEVMLKETSINLLSLADINCLEEIAETAATIEGNAKIKADYIFEKYKMDCFADDSGLEVDVLNGEPGVKSARFAGDQKDNQANILLLLKKMEGMQNRKARFKTIIALHFNGLYKEFEGIIEGEITTAQRGDQGFGYDSVFRPKGELLTFAQMSASQKNKISHRAIAIEKMMFFLLEFIKVKQIT